MLRDMLEKREIRMKEVTKQAEETQISHKTLRLMIIIMVVDLSLVLFIIHASITDSIETPFCYFVKHF